jgi:hypothetical protein
MDTFQLELDHETTAPDLMKLPNVPIKNVIIAGEDGDTCISYLENEFQPGSYSDYMWKTPSKYPNMQACSDFVIKYKATIENLTLVDLKVTFDVLAQLLTNMDSLKNLTLGDIKPDYSSCSLGVNLPKLESLTIDCVLECIYDEKLKINLTEQMFNLFKGNDSITNLQLAMTNAYSCVEEVKSKKFLEFMETLPNVKHLTLKGPNIVRFLNENLSSKLETLNTVSLDTDVKFLQKQKKTLKELRLEKLPSSPGSSAIVRAIFEDMHLETFYLKNQALILNSEKQHAESSIDCDGIEPTLELLKHGRCKYKNKFLIQ